MTRAHLVLTAVFLAAGLTVAAQDNPAPSPAPAAAPPPPAPAQTAAVTPPADPNTTAAWSRGAEHHSRPGGH